VPRIHTVATDAGADVTIAPTAKLHAYLTIAGVALVAGVAAGRPQLAAAGVAFAVYLTRALDRAPRFDAPGSARLTRERVLEGDRLALEVRLPASAGVERVELRCAPAAGVRPRGVPIAVAATTDEVAIELSAERWGAARLRGVGVRAIGVAGLRTVETTIEVAQVVRVYPTPEQLAAIVEPALTGSFTGAQSARVAGDGAELVGVRPFVPGDRVRRMNWRATARLGLPHVTERLDDRNADIVLFLDTFADVRSRAGGTLDSAVRAAAAFAHAHLERGDRVGVVGFGGTLHWLAPGLGDRQRYRIVEALIESEIVFSYAWKDVGVLPQGALPPRALVIALTPLVDERAITALLDLRARGFDIAVIDISPERHTASPQSEIAELALRLWRLQRAALRSRFEDAGVAVSAWRPERGLRTNVEEVTQFRRYATRAGSA
jgi:uncharacterized protein (DUF58 family)